MAQIRKLRIVNLYYNGGKRLIADELFDFCDGKDDPVKSALLNLENGGGKSVLVQLMMQPVIPKAKASGRKVEGFFTKADMHSYIVIEWKKDDSPEYLMTGISMETHTQNDDETRGNAVRYYTFYANYSDYRNDYNIVSLALSSRENNRFVPADYDYVKKLSRQRDQLTCYASDDSVKWREKLQEYGLMSTEWRMIEKLNSVEGGMSEYFKGFAKSDNLVDDLLIKTIEEKMKLQTSEQEDSSLVTMFMNHARQYMTKQTIINDRDEMKHFLEELKLRYDEAGALWQTKDEEDRLAGEIFAFYEALNQQCRALTEQSNRIQQELDALRAKTQAVRYEEASYEYWCALDAYEKIDQELQGIQKTYQNLEQQEADTEHLLYCYESARYYNKRKVYEGELRGLQSQLESLEKGSDSNRELAQLKYSIVLQLNRIMPEVKAKMDSLEQTISACRTELETLNQKKQVAIKERDQAKTAYDEQEGVRKHLCEENVKNAEKLQIQSCRMLGIGLGIGYQEQDLEGERQAKEPLLDRIRNEIRNFNAQKDQQQERLNAIPGERAEVEFQKKEKQAEKEAKSEELNQYLEIENQIQSICKLRSIDFATRFDGVLMDSLKKNLSAEEAKKGKNVRQRELTEESIKAVTNGTLHVPKAVIDYIDSTNCKYRTCENYLLSQVKEGNLTKERVLEILRLYPSAAYGIVMDAAERDKLFTFEREKWLPAMVPVFTSQQLLKIQEQTTEAHGAIAFYSVEYFENKDMYRLQLEASHDNLNQLIEQNNQEIADLQQEMKVAEIFAAYDEGSMVRMKAGLEQMDVAICQYDQKMQQLQAEADQCREAIRQLTQQISEKQEEQLKMEEWFRNFDRFLENVQKENRLAEECDKLESVWRKLAAEAEQLEQNLKQNQQKLDETRGLAQVNQTQYDEMLSITMELGEAAETELLDGDWKELHVRYRKLSEAQSADIKSIKDQIHTKNELVQDTQKEIKKRNCNLEDYENLVPSEEKESQLADDIRGIKEQEKENSANLMNIKQKFGACEEKKEKAEARLQKEFNAGAMARESIGSDFDRRIQDLERAEDTQKKQAKTVGAQLNKCESLQEKVKDKTEEIHLPDQYRMSEVKLQENPQQQWEQIWKAYQTQKAQFSSAYKAFGTKLGSLRIGYWNHFDQANQIIGNLETTYHTESKGGDSLYTLYEQMDSFMHSLGLRIQQIETDLDEFDKTFRDLVRQCVEQGSLIYDGLLQLVKSSSVKVYEDKPKKQMLRLDLPAEIDSNVARQNIEAELEAGTKELAEMLQSGKPDDPKVISKARKIVGSERLLRKYVGKDRIRLEAFKIDRNPQNAEYRSWDETQVNNSGAEKSIVYFAVVLALMNYTRRVSGNNTSESTGVLILDNPFGATSSSHILEPMFELARHFHVQMICLSAIDNSNVVKCFDQVIQVKVKRRIMSSLESLEHEGNEKIEHGYYRAEQMKLDIQ